MRIRLVVAALAMTIAAPSAQTRPPCPLSLPDRRPEEARAVWVWDSPRLLASPSERRVLLELCRCAGIDRLWIQIALDRERGADGTPRLARADEWRTLVREVHAAGLMIEALEGSPAYALERNHPEALAIVDAVVAYNRRADAAARFDGLHFDIEPHGLYRWRFPEARERMVTGLVRLLVEAQRRLKAEGLRFGVALPFWLQTIDAATQEPIGAMTLEGRRASAAHHLLDRLDYVAIMSYRDRAIGPNGFTTITRELLNYASAPGRARVFLGLETAAGLQRVRFVTGLPREQQLARMRAAGEDPDELTPIDGYRLSLADDGTRLHVGVRLRDGESMDAASLLEVLRKVAARYGLRPSTDDTGRRTADAALSLALGTLARDGEWLDLKPSPIPDEEGRLWPGFSGRSVTPAGVTFAGQPLGDLQRAMRDGAAAVAGKSGFAGFALHDYEHLAALRSQ